MHLFRQDLFVLEDDEHFAECRGVQSLLPQLQRETLKRGTALDLLIQGAVADVLAELYSSDGPQAERLAQFLHHWFHEHKSVVEIASTVHLDRTTVSRILKGPSLVLVAARFLHLAQLDEPASESPGLQEALRQREQRRNTALARVASMRPTWDHTPRGITEYRLDPRLET
jgi:hypothetical protein